MMGIRKVNRSAGLFALALCCVSLLARAMPPAAPNGAPATVLLQSTPNPSGSGAAVSFTAAVSAANAQASSSFNAPAENPLSEGGKWVSPVNPNSSVALQKDANHQVYSTQVHKDSAARYDGQTFSGDQFSQATIVNQNGNTVEGVLVRLQGDTDANCYGLVNFYGAFYSIVRINDNNTEMKFVQTGDDFQAGGRLADYGPKPKNGDAVRLEISGSPNPTLTAYLNGVLLGSVVDTGTTDAFGFHPPLSGGQPGIYTYVNTNANITDSVLTNWSGGGLPSGSTPTGTVTFSDGSTVLGSGTLNAIGQTSFSTPALSNGTHSITAAYSGDANFTSATSPTLFQVVGSGQPSMVTVMSSPNPSSSGQAVTFSASVSSITQGQSASSNFNPPAENPLSEGGKWVTPVNSITTIAVRKDATNTISPSAAGGAMARYDGQTYSANQFAQATIVNRGASTVEGVLTRIQSDMNASSYGFVDMFGSYYSIVRLQDYGNYLRFVGTSSSFNGGRIMDFAVQPHAGDVIRLEVSGSPNPTLKAYVNGTLLGSAVDSGQTDGFGSYSPLLGGQPGVFLDMSTGSPVTPQLGSWSGGDIGAGAGSSVPTGTVTFLDGATSLGVVTLDNAGLASLTTSGLSTGSHSITVTYAGDSTFATATSSPLSQVVGSGGGGGPAATVTALSSSLNPSNVGQAVTFNAAVTSGSGTPSGSVTFADGNTNLGTVSLDGTGHAAYTTATLANGSHSITAAYAGNANYQASTSSAMTQVVNTASGLGGSKTTLISSLNPSVFGQSVTFTATSVPTGGLQATSTFDGAAENPLSEGGKWLSPLKTITIAVQKNGDHTISPSGAGVAAMARYDGQTYTDDQFAQATITAQGGSTVQGVLVRMQGDTNVSGYAVVDFYGSFYSLARIADYGNYLRFVGNSSSFNGGRLMDFAVTPKAGDVIRLEASGDPNPTLTVYLNGSVLGSVVDTGQTDSFGSYPPLSGGQPGVMLYMSTGSSVTPGLSTWSGGDLAPPDPVGVVTGSVAFNDGATTLGTVLLDASGHASFSTSALAVASHSMTAVYGGDSQHTSSSSATLVQVVGSASTMTTIASSVNPSLTGQSVTLTSNVTSSGGIPSGTVAFYDGSTTLGTATLNGSGQAALSVSFSTGTHSLTAQYAGNGTFSGSTSSALSQVTNPPPTTTAMVTSVVPASFGQAITFTAKVTAAAGTPSGPVSFFDGNTNIGTANLNSAGIAALTTSSLAAGSHAMTASFAGDSSVGGSTSPVLYELVMAAGQARSVTVLASSVNPSAPGQSVTLTATVSGSAGLTASSTFDGPAQNPLSEGGNWTTPVDSPSTVGVQSDGNHNVILPTLASAGVARYVGTLFLEDQFAQATIVEGDGNTLEGVTVRMQSDTNASSYALLCYWGSSYAIVRVYDTGSYLRFVNTLATFATHCQVGDVIKLQISGAANPTLTAYLNGNSLGSAIDTGSSDWMGTYAPLNGGQPGLFMYRTAASAFAPMLTAWSGGDLNAPSASGTPTGTVTFYDGNTVLNTTALNPSGVASFNTSALTAGSHPIVALYSGDGAFVGSAAAINQQVITAPE